MENLNLDSNHQLITHVQFQTRSRTIFSRHLQTSSQAIRLEITDERDPYFLYFMEIDETDYFNLKKQQQIRVDFNDFPEKLVELIRSCGTFHTPSSSNIPHTLKSNTHRYRATTTTAAEEKDTGDESSGEAER